MKKTLIIFLFIPFLVLGRGKLSFAQTTSVIDSLLIVLQSAKEDTDKVKMLNDLCWEYTKTDPKMALEYGAKAIKIAEKFLNSYDKAIVQLGKKRLSEGLNNTGVAYSFLGNYDRALENWNKVMKINKERGHKKGIASNLNNIAIVYEMQGKYEKAMANYLKSLKIREELEDKKGIAGSLNNIGLVYENLKNYKKALEYYLQSLKIKKELKDKEGIANSLSNIGNIYFHLNKYQESIDYHLQSLKIKEDFGDKQGIAISLNNIGLVYRHQGKYNNAIDYFLKSLKANEALHNKQGISLCLNNIAVVYSNQGLYNKAIEYSKKSLIIAKEIEARNDIKRSYKALAETYAGQNSYKEAYEYHQLYFEIKDSLFNEESSKQIAEMQEKYESEKREKEIELLNKEKSLQATVLNRQKIIIWSVAGGLLLVIALAFFIYRGYRQKQKANVLLTAQKQVIETKNKDITDSIRYAENIQRAILPTNEQIKELLPDSFVLFKPKDIVSGDFYWITALDLQGSPPVGGRGVLIAACDCTGHGVPGAFMSMMINSLLNEVVNDLGITKPNEILYEVRKGIIDSLKQKGESGDQKDGMDAALCSIDFKNMKLEYAGANNPLYLIRKGELQQIRADKQPVGFLTEEEKPFTNHEIDLQKGDTIYIFSDGYQDQFGGEKDKKFMVKRFRELLLSIQDKLMDEQKEILNKTIKDWQGNSEQVDDVLVIGVKM